MRVLVAGGTGFIGMHLVRALLDRGDVVTVLTRDVAGGKKTLPRECRVVSWEPGKKGPWYEELPFVDAVVNLAGASVAKRWTDDYKKKIRQSRVKATESLVEAIALAGESKARNARRPAVLVNASGCGYYGASTAGEVSEEDEAGEDFLATVCRDWEAAAEQAAEHGVRVVRLRIGVVIGKGGGAAENMAPGKRIVLGPVGKGDNTMSWVHVDDVVGMILWAVDDAAVSGALNCTSPFPATARELSQSIASVIDKRRIGVPEALVRPMLGDAVEMLLGDQKVYPKRAVDLGYAFHYARLVPALEQALMSD